jgi:hypothetical protein
LSLITFKVKLLGATAGSKQLYTSSDPYCIIDSGTTLVYLRTDAYNQFVSELNSLCKQKKSLPGVCSVQNDESLFTGYCFTMTSAEIANFPDIIFTLDTAGNVSLPSSTYLLPQEGSDNTTYYCLVVFSGKIDHPHIIDSI